MLNLSGEMGGEEMELYNLNCDGQDWCFALCILVEMCYQCVSLRYSRIQLPVNLSFSLAALLVNARSTQNNVQKRELTWCALMKPDRVDLIQHCLSGGYQHKLEGGGERMVVIHI